MNDAQELEQSDAKFAARVWESLAKKAHLSNEDTKFLVKCGAFVAAAGTGLSITSIPHSISVAGVAVHIAISTLCAKAASPSAIATLKTAGVAGLTGVWHPAGSELVVAQSTLHVC